MPCRVCELSRDRRSLCTVWHSYFLRGIFLGEGMKRTIKAGMRFSNLTIIKESDAIYWKKYRKRRVLCLCDCGKATIVLLDYLCNRHTKSCGCIRGNNLTKLNKTHGSTPKRLYGIWGGMLARCRNSNVKSYKYYGGKGVEVCTDWETYENFRSWALSNGYKSNLTIDRINPFGNYEPQNCRWIPRSKQAATRRNCVKFRHICEQQRGKPLHSI